MSAAFDVVFGVFVAAMVALASVAVRWALRRDRAARARLAQQGVDEASVTPGPAPDRRTP